MRNELGHWVKGTTGNPGGRPKMDQAIKASLREMTPELVARLRTLALCADTDASSIAAIKLLLAYTWGLPSRLDQDGDAPQRTNPLDELTVDELRSLARQSLAAEAEDDAGDNEADEPGH